MNHGKSKEHMEKGAEKYNRSDILAGRNPVLEALKSERPINKILVTKGEKKGSIKEIIGMAREKKVIIQEVNADFLYQLVPDVNHQGVAALVSPFEYVEVEDILKKAEQSREDAFVILADGINDPHNLGALIRTAEAAGAHGMIIPKRHCVPVTSTVAKASSGAVEYLPVARETNMVRCIEGLKKEGLWVIGADADGESQLYEVDLKMPVALVVGGEGRGIGRLVKEKCDIVVRIPMKGNITSLNASVAGAVLMYEVVRQRS